MITISNLLCSFHYSFDSLRIVHLVNGRVGIHSRAGFCKRAFSRGIPYNPEGTIQDFTCSPRHIGIGKLIQEKDEELYGKLRQHPQQNNSAYTTRGSAFGEGHLQNYLKETPFESPLVTTREGTRAMLAAGRGGRSSTVDERQNNRRMKSITTNSDTESGDTSFFCSDLPRSRPNAHQSHSTGLAPHSVKRIGEENNSLAATSPLSMKEFYAEASMSSSGNTYQKDCRTDPRYAHLPPHVRSAQQSILDMQHDSFGENIRGMVPPPPQLPQYCSAQHNEELRAYTPPRISIPPGWGVAVGAFITAFTFMALYGK